MDNNLSIKNAGPSQQNSPETEALFKQGLMHHQAGRIDEAFRTYRKILDADPEHADSLHMTGLIALQTGQHETAFSLVSQAIQFRGDVPFYYNTLGNVLFKMDRFDEAAVSYQQAIRLKNNFQMAYRNLAGTLRKQGKLAEAAVQYENALSFSPNPESAMNCDFQADGLGTAGKSLKFMESAAFRDAWRAASETAIIGWSAGVPDVRWRVHVAIWAAQNGLKIEGDFVECGVHTAMLSISLCTLLDFGALKDRKIWLFDTWAGIPLEGLSEQEKNLAEHHNTAYYKSEKVYGAVDQVFSTRFPNSRLVRGILPGSLKDAGIEKIAYLSMDLNNAAAEKGCIDILWPKLTPGAFVVLDDYGWTAHRDQQDMWDNFAAAQGRTILTLPTGQGLLIK